MRKHQQNQILDIIATLNEANAEIKRLFLCGEISSVLELLRECQNGVVQIGEFIERIEGEGTQTVTLLEEYHESLYSIGMGIETVDTSFIKHLKKQLLFIENSVRTELAQNKIEVVFLPYKASMWDSLESIWLAAKADSQCDVYVIPIPYFDKNPDGSFREMHYEGKHYPEYVHVIDYKQYDFEGRRPDVVFIHNPYDDRNYVTSVDPFFYSRNLKKFTDNLVYVPYFIMAEISPNDQEAVERVEHYCTVPGVYNADKVIVQSENIRKIYVDVLTKVTSKDMKKHWESKVLGLGSPKVDKVLNTKKEDLDIPEDWLKIIQKPDGSWKKIVFYNITVGTFLKSGEKMLDKIEDVLAVFEMNKEELALLWRPHPLIKSTLISMRPQLWKRYRKIREQYIQEGWGIYDDTADMDRAVVLSDAYYGDQSSVLQLYKMTDKPIMIQNTEVHSEDNIEKSDKIRVWAHDFCVDGNDIWFVSGKPNVLFKYNVLSNETKVVSLIQEEQLFQQGSFCSIIKGEKHIFLIPAWARNIHIYDVMNQSFTKIKLKNIVEYDKQILFVKGLLFDGYIYCIPSSYSFLVRICTKDLKVDYLPFDIGLEGQYVGNAVKLNDTYFAGVVSGTNMTFKYNTRLDLMERFVLSEDRRLYDLSCLSDMLYLVDDKEKEIIKVLSKDLNIIKGTIKLQFAPVAIRSIGQDKLLIDSLNSYQLAVIDRDGKVMRMKKGDDNHKNKGFMNYSYCFGVLKEFGKYHYYMDRNDNIMFRFKDEKSKEIIFWVEYIQFKESVLAWLRNTQVVNVSENNIIKLEYFIEGVIKQLFLKKYISINGEIEYKKADYNSIWQN